MTGKNYRFRMLLFCVIITFIIGSACTSSNSSLQTNPNYNKNFNSPTRTPEKYANPDGLSESETKTPSDLPVSIMQISLEVPQVEVNEPYNLYALVSNPSEKDAQYEWHVTSGKLLPVTEEDKPRLKELTDKAKEMSPASGATSGAAGTETPPATGTEKTVDGKVVPGTVPPDEALKNRPTGATPAAGEFKEGEPVPPPQLQTGEEKSRVEPGQPAVKTPSGAPSPVEITTDEDGMTTNIVAPTERSKDTEIAAAIQNRQLASAWIDRAFGVRYALLAMQDETETTTEESTESAPADETSSDTAEPETTTDEPATDETTEETAPAETETTETTLTPEGSGTIEELFEESGETETSEAATTEEETPSSVFDREFTPEDKGTPMKHWPTPWETGDKEAVADTNGADESDKLITDIQKQISDEISLKEAADNAIANREPVKLMTNDPYVRWIPDTAETVTISLIMVNPKGVDLTEPTVLDVEVVTPQPKIDLSYTMPEDGLEPGDTLDVALKVENIPDYRRSLIGVSFDLNNFDVSEVKLGDLFDNGNNASLYYAQPDKSSGMVTVAISLEDLIRSVRGSGEAFVISFTAKAAIPADITDLGFTISKEANYRYIQDTSGENQLPPDASTLPTLQTKLVEPPQPEAPAAPAEGAEGATGTAGIAGTGTGVAGTGTAGTGGTPPTVGGPVITGEDGLPVDTGARGGGGTRTPDTSETVPTGTPDTTPSGETHVTPPTDDGDGENTTPPPTNGDGAPISSIG